MQVNMDIVALLDIHVNYIALERSLKYAFQRATETLTYEIRDWSLD
jgi:hypothetical protein